MKRSQAILSAIIVLILFAFEVPSEAQISHGGRPLPLSITKSDESLMTVEMPAVNIEEELRLDSLNNSDLRSGYRFATKFVVDYDRTNSGTQFTTADGTKVWRLRIHSEGAYSINVLFTKYHLPDGARLFLYNPDQTQILGSFTSLNNSENNLLPVAPVQGDELIVEYQEPAQAAFAGSLTIGEVNHAYRDVLRFGEPYGTTSEDGCMPALRCSIDTIAGAELAGRSVVLMVIDGSTLCTGTLVNNTDNDGKPYLLTSSHCLNDGFAHISADYYAKMAGSIVCFYNYDSPLCRTILRGTEEMSTASATMVSVNEDHDEALLLLGETPPVDYMPYYSGWNASLNFAGPYFGIHHPQGSVKRVNSFVGTLTTYTPDIEEYKFPAGLHLLVNRWTSGITAGGSSGSPLFDASGKMIGALTGGNSVCEDPVNDYYYSLAKAWADTTAINRQLKHWLAPALDTLKWNGLDPYQNAPCYRLSNVRQSGFNEKVEVTPLSSTDATPLFGNNTSGITQYAEQYDVSSEAYIQGVYLVSSATGSTLNVEVSVYEDNNAPTNKLASQTFSPAYQRYYSYSFKTTTKSLSRKAESYLAFESPVKVKGRFYVSYTITPSSSDTTHFAVLNIPKGNVTGNTAWYYYNKAWQQATSHPSQAFATSLYLDPVVRYSNPSAVENVDEQSDIKLFVEPTHRTLHVVLPESMPKARLSVYAANGTLVAAKDLTESVTSISLSSLPKGIYIANITKNNISFSRKVLF